MNRYSSVRSVVQRMSANTSNPPAIFDNFNLLGEYDEI
jgi:hypothetical protein